MIYFDKKQRMSPHFVKGRFYNYKGEKRQHVLLPSLRMMIACQLAGTQACKEEIEAWVAQEQPLQRSHELAITWIGHSTFLIQVGGYTIITDPVFGNLPLFKRITPVGIPLDTLPPIDFVLISHNHRDHMDAYSIKALVRRNPDVKFLVGQGDGGWFKRHGIERVQEHMWWDAYTVTQETPLKLTFLPAFHWSQRGLFDFNRSLWGSWIVECAGQTVYFAGDTAYANHFKAIGEEFPFIDVALMPIGPCEPHSLMAHAHVNAEEAGQAFIDLGARCFIPMHWGTYYFGTDTFMAPHDRILSWWRQQNFVDKELLVLKVGQRIMPHAHHATPEIAAQLALDISDSESPIL